MMVLSFAFAKAQRGIRVGYVDMAYILESVPEYQKASDQLEQRMQTWKVEIEKMESDINQMEASLKNERILLTKELVEEREEEIEIKRQQLNDYQQKRFGAQGDFIKQKQQLIQPVQDQVFNEMQKIGEQKKYDMILERSETTMLYSDDRHDLSDDVLKAIGRTGKKNDREEVRASRNNPTAAADEPYMSVQEAADKQEKVIAKQEIVDDRAAVRAEKIRVRDSIKEARARAYKERRDSIINERTRKKDSILAVRKAAKEKKEEERENNNPSDDN